MPNLEAKITNHNKAILANSSRISNDEINQCNCRKNLNVLSTAIA